MVIKIIHTVHGLRQLMSVFALAFEEQHEVSDEYLERMLKTDSIVILGAYKNDENIGGLVAMEMLPLHGAKELYIYDIAVHPKHQNRGVGTALLEELKREAKNRGAKTIFVDTESEDAGAVAFYRSVGGKEMAATHFTFHLS